jgi:hypothetical protein
MMNGCEVIGQLYRVLALRWLPWAMPRGGEGCVFHCASIRYNGSLSSAKCSQTGMYR